MNWRKDGGISGSGGECMGRVEKLWGIAVDSVSVIGFPYGTGPKEHKERNIGNRTMADQYMDVYIWRGEPVFLCYELKSVSGAEGGGFLPRRLNF